MVAQIPEDDEATGREPDFLVIDSDITALTAAADKVIRVGGPEPNLMNLELQSSHAADLVETLWLLGS